MRFCGRHYVKHVGSYYFLLNKLPSIKPRGKGKGAWLLIVSYPNASSKASLPSRVFICATVSCMPWRMFAMHCSPPSKRYAS